LRFADVCCNHAVTVCSCSAITWASRPVFFNHFAAVEPSAIVCVALGTYATINVSILLQPHKTVIANLVPGNFGLFRRNPWQPLAKSRLKNSGLGKAFDKKDIKFPPNKTFGLELPAAPRDRSGSSADAGAMEPNWAVETCLSKWLVLGILSLQVKSRSSRVADIPWKVRRQLLIEPRYLPSTWADLLLLFLGRSCSVTVLAASSFYWIYQYIFGQTSNLLSGKLKSHARPSLKQCRFCPTTSARLAQSIKWFPRRNAVNDYCLQPGGHCKNLLSDAICLSKVLPGSVDECVSHY